MFVKVIAGLYCRLRYLIYKTGCGVQSPERTSEDVALYERFCNGVVV